jgi:hypothetical protein
MLSSGTHAHSRDAMLFLVGYDVIRYAILLLPPAYRVAFSLEFAFVQITASCPSSPPPHLALGLGPRQNGHVPGGA